MSNIEYRNQNFFNFKTTLLLLFLKLSTKRRPSKQEGKQWPAYNNNTAPYYEFSEYKSNKGTNRRIYNQNWKRELCTDLWQKYLLPK